jgi:hypothetical protein
MRVQVLVLAPGLQAEPYQASVSTFHKVRFRDRAGVELMGLGVEIDARPHYWRSSRLVIERVDVLLGGILDLRLRWPMPGTSVQVKVDGAATPTRAHHIDELAPYELADILGGLPPLPRSILSVSRDELVRIDLLWSAGLATCKQSLEELLGPLTQASTAAAATHPYDRVTPLWSALELLTPDISGDLRRIDALLSQPGFADDEGARGASVIDALLLHRPALAADSWLYPPVRARLARPPTTAAERVATATVAAYAIRSKVVHGQWARARDTRRSEARAAEAWLWQLLEREIEHRLVGGRLPFVRSATSAAFTV